MNRLVDRINPADFFGKLKEINPRSSNISLPQLIFLASNIPTIKLYELNAQQKTLLNGTQLPHEARFRIGGIIYMPKYWMRRYPPVDMADDTAFNEPNTILYVNARFFFSDENNEKIGQQAHVDISCPLQISHNRYGLERMRAETIFSATTNHIPFQVSSEEKPEAMEVYVTWFLHSLCYAKITPTR
ncbi:hypothetical protein C4579_02090 [Candidatus Microgenomates bacterium]|nr:MAG: hypothetical protein C4579_02090 [Candidatus Microgenomates bacterium]